MIQTPSIGISAAHTFGVHLLPGAAAALGGVLAWKLWRQRRQKRKPADHSPQLNQPQREGECLDGEPSAQATATDRGKHALFDRLIDDNVAIRQAAEQ